MLLIQNGLLYTMEEEKPFVGDILIRDGKIEKIAEKIEKTERMECYDAKGLLVFPGFIDAHSHLGVAEEKMSVLADSSNEATTPITPMLRAMDTINPMDSAFHNALAAGITGVQAGMGIAGMIREELFLAKQYLEKNDRDAEEKDFRLESYRELFAGEIPLKAHVHRADDIFTAIRIAKEFGLGLTLDHCTEGHLIAEKIAESGFSAIVGPSLTSRSKYEVSELDFKTAGVLKKAGVTVALTTDHPVSRIQYLPLCAGLAAKEGLGEYNALRAITIDAAKICRVDQRIGSLKEGKDADLVILNGSPLEIRSDVLTVFINGKKVWEKGAE